MISTKVNMPAARRFEAWIIPQSRALLRRAPLVLNQGTTEEAVPEAVLHGVCGLGDFATKCGKGWI